MSAKKVHSKQSIIDASMELFASKGFGSTLIREIARTAHTTIPNIYYYFGSKEGLYSYVLQDAMARFEASVAAAATGASVREELIAMDKAKHHFMAQNPNIMRLLLGKPLSEDDLVFGNINGSPKDPGTLTHNFARIARKARLAGTRFHDLRHTFASLMLLAGVHPKMVSKMLGHSSVAFTLDTYSHVIGGLQGAAMRRLDEVLQPELAETQYVSKMLATNPETGQAMAGFELPEYKNWQEWEDSNPRPAVLETAALTN